jgi:glycosyltransferase involved in cell wall biosynthesis
MDGADKRAWHLYEGMIAAGGSGTFVGRTAIVRNMGAPEHHSPARCWRDQKTFAALVAFATGQDYWQLKMLRPGARQAVARAVQDQPEIVIVNFLYALKLLQKVPRPYRLLIDTHNYDPACFRAMAEGTHNPVLRSLCRRAARASEQTLQALPRGTTLVHVSERDASQYWGHRPDLEHQVVENGTIVRPRALVPDYGAAGNKVLLFVGSLSAKINQDALRHFASQFWPHLRDHAEFHVAGSAPPASVHELCAQEGWPLHPNVAEDELERLYAQAHFATLPFAYGEGSKLKLFEACGRGVPVLATSAGVVGVRQPPPLVTVSDEAAVWRAQLAATRRLSDQAVGDTLAFADEFSWPKLARKLMDIARQCPLIR